MRQSLGMLLVSLISDIMGRITKPQKQKSSAFKWVSNLRSARSYVTITNQPTMYLYTVDRVVLVLVLVQEMQNIMSNTTVTIPGIHNNNCLWTFINFKPWQIRLNVQDCVWARLLVAPPLPFRKPLDNVSYQPQGHDAGRRPSKFSWKQVCWDWYLPQFIS